MPLNWKTQPINKLIISKEKKQEQKVPNNPKQYPFVFPLTDLVLKCLSYKQYTFL